MSNLPQTTPDPLAAFKTELHNHLKAALDAPTPAAQEVQRLLSDLDQASTTLESSSVQEVRNALESIRDQERKKRGAVLAVAICEVAGSHGLMMRPANPPRRTGSSGSRPRYSPDQRRQITRRCIEAIKAEPDAGLTKAELAQQLNLTPNQIKRILQWPEVQRHIHGIGHARNRRYALKATPATPNQGAE